MSGVQEMKLDIVKILLVKLCAFNSKNAIVLTPDD